MRLAGLTLAASSAPPEPHKTKGEGKLSPNLFLGILALATVPADAYEDSRANLL